MLKLCLSTKFPNQEIGWNYGIFWDGSKNHYAHDGSIDHVMDLNAVDGLDTPQTNFNYVCLNQTLFALPKFWLSFFVTIKAYFKIKFFIEKLLSKRNSTFHLIILWFAARFHSVIPQSSFTYLFRCYVYNLLMDNFIVQSVFADPCSSFVVFLNFEKLFKLSVTLKMRFLNSCIFYIYGTFTALKKIF